jgi:hypothetical protein
LVASYGVERGRLKVGRRSGSFWWREIAIRDGVGGVKEWWFGEGVTQKVGDGLDTFFRTNLWLDGNDLLCERFGHLFYLVESKSSTVAELSALEWETGEEA